MHLFTDYIQPLTHWLQDNPKLALFITFLISLTESLAIIGSIIPGSVTMTAIGILAGSGIMRIDLTLIAAALGAIAGDGVSYFLGYLYSDRLTSIWPFSHYPNLLSYGKDYFAKHGGKSVLIGRFVGPLRSIIPVIAGMMHMSHGRFYIANIISAIGWSILHVMPGVLIGAASSELSPEIATRLFLLILFILVGIWLISTGIKWLFIRLNRILQTKLHHYWLGALNNRYLAKPARFLTPADETTYYLTATLFFAFILCLVLFFLLTGFVSTSEWAVDLNQTTHLFFQSSRTRSFDIFFIILSQIISPLTLTSLVVSVSLVAIYSKDWRAFIYWLSLTLSCTLALVVFYWGIAPIRLEGILELDTSSSLAISQLTFATALFVSLVLYINAYSQTRFKHLLKVTIALSLLAAGFAQLYLGDSWLSDILGAFLCGLSLSLAHWLLYRRYKPQGHYTPYIPLTILVLLFIASLISDLFSYQSSMRNHQPYFVQYVFTAERWWNQTRPLLPIYRTNRIGRRISLFNLQYAGSLSNLEEALTNYGWKKQNDSLLSTIITQVSGQSSLRELPFMAQLYLNKKPVLVMTYEPADGNPVQIVRIWRSNYHLQNYTDPIWLGSVHPRLTTLTSKNNFADHPKSIIYLSSALSPASFLQHRIPFPVQVVQQKLPTQAEPVLLLLRETR